MTKFIMIAVVIMMANTSARAQVDLDTGLIIEEDLLNTVEPQEPLTFMGYECTVDCSGHEAGYAWAEDKEITDPDDCGGNSESFIEGCIAYAEEN